MYYSTPDTRKKLHKNSCDGRPPADWDALVRAAALAEIGRRSPLANIARFVPASVDHAPELVSPQPLVDQADLNRGANQVRRWAKMRAQRASAKLYRDYWSGLLTDAGLTPPPTPLSSAGYERVCLCTWARWSAAGVKVCYSSEHQRSTYKGLVTCKSPWMCPLCMSVLAEARAHELQKFVKAARAQGCTVVLGRFSDRHEKGETNNVETLTADLAAQVDYLLDSFRRMKMGGNWWRKMQDRFGVPGPGRSGNLQNRLYSVRGFETTWGYNGFHPHLHPIYILAPGADWEAFAGEMRDKWYTARGGVWSVDPETGEIVPADRERWEHGCYFTCNDGEVADYILKYGRDPRWDVGQEVTKAAVKVGRQPGKSKHWSMMELLYSYMDTGNALHGRLWLAFGYAMKGRHQLQWSPGARDWAGLGAEATDEEVFDEAENNLQDLAVVDDLTWHLIRLADRRADLLAAADKGDPAEVQTWLADFRAEPLTRSRLWPPKPPLRNTG